MNRTQRSIVLLVSFLSLAGCGRSHYFLRLDTPPELEGFLGFRWTAPTDVIERHFLQYSSGSVPMPELTTSFVPAYSNVMFLSKRAVTCQFFTGPGGYYEAKLVFKTTEASSAEDVRYFQERLSEVYGRSRGGASYADPYTLENSLANYSWLDCRLELTLTPDTTIVISAFERSPCHHQVKFMLNGND